MAPLTMRWPFPINHQLRKFRKSHRLAYNLILWRHLFILDFLISDDLSLYQADIELARICGLCVDVKRKIEEAGSLLLHVGLTGSGFYSS